MCTRQRRSSFIGLLLAAGSLGLSVQTGVAHSLTPLDQTRAASGYLENLACEGFVDPGLVEASDFNLLDETVQVAAGASDLANLLASWGPCADCPTDFDGNGVVDAADLASLLSNWGCQSLGDCRRG